MDLERELKKRLETKSILLMTHLMLGYPSLAVNREVIAQMAANGVDCIELQIPFSEPIADGPVILRAGQRSLEQGTSVEECFRFGQIVERGRQTVAAVFARRAAQHPKRVLQPLSQCDIALAAQDDMGMFEARPW